MEQDIEEMFCYQCEQTVRGQNKIGCTKIGVCTKNPQVAYLQDLIMFGAGLIELDPEFYVKAVFSTLTNVNHNVQQLEDILSDMCQKVVENQRNKQKIQFFGEKCQNYFSGQYYATIGPLYYKQIYGDDINSIIQLTLQCFKGCSAYADHVVRGIHFLQQDTSISNQQSNSEQFKNSLSETYKDVIKLIQKMQQIHNYIVCDNVILDQGLQKLLQMGQINFQITKHLNDINYIIGGDVQLSDVKLNIQPGPCILISGHDITDAYSLLQQCQKEGINVYTHGELLPAHMYQRFKKFDCFKGNFGLSWWHQQVELQHFPGPILFTTNCIMKPLQSYIDRVYATGCVGYEGVKYIDNDKWEDIILKAKELGGFKTQEQCDNTIKALDQTKYYGNVGFDHRVFNQNQEKIINLVKQGKITDIYVIGGCDGFKTQREYYKRVAQNAPQTSLILTLACGRFRLNGVDFGKIDNISRLLDVGQCNDVYAAIMILVNLSKALNIEINKLPVHYYIQWYEQKAIVQFITLLSFNIQNIELGPTLPACISSNVLNLLKEKYNVSLMKQN